MTKEKEKLYISMPDDRMIQMQIKQIVAAGTEPKESFISYIKSMYRRMGFRFLFSDRSELVYILMTAAILLSIFMIRPNPAQVEIQDVYAYIFLISPVIFLAFSIYTYSNKRMNNTYELEKVCKYHVYQIIAFRMLAFSIVAILVNTMTIGFFAIVYEGIQFLRALMISITGLFAFSVIFLYVLMKRRSTLVAAITIIGWVLVNLLFINGNNKLYSDVLVNMPLLVYGLILAGSLYFYWRRLNQFIHLNHRGVE